MAVIFLFVYTETHYTSTKTNTSDFYYDMSEHVRNAENGDN